MAGYKRICHLCGKEYKYCSSCRGYSNQPAWKNMFHSENCDIIFNLAVQFVNKKKTVKEAQEILSKCDLTDINNFRQDVIEQINIIQNSKPTVIEEKVDKQVETKDKTKDETKDETKVSQKENVDVKDVLPEATTFRKKKKSMKKSSDKRVFNEQ